MDITPEFLERLARAHRFVIAAEYKDGEQDFFVFGAQGNVAEVSYLLLRLYLRDPRLKDVFEAVAKCISEGMNVDGILQTMKLHFDLMEKRGQ